jgi:ribosomal protein S18 acetylase RimI-like enzyme
MIVRSLGYRTDLMLARFDGDVVDRGGYMVVRTPSSPAFWWGNFLLFDRPPRRTDAVEWEERFTAEFASIPGVRHVNLAWQSGAGEVEAFVARGYAATSNVYLAASIGALRGEPEPAGIRIRTLQSDADWAAALANQRACLGPEQDTPVFRAFQVDQMHRYRRMAAAGFGVWLGAFAADRLVADMGVFGTDGLGRCQAVATASDFRRRGIASGLIRRAAREAGERLAAGTIVIMTGEDHPARRLYERIGFRPVEIAASVARSGPPQ